MNISSITFTEAIRQALEKSPEIGKLNVAVARTEMEEPFLLAETDPRFETGYRWRDDQSPRQVPAFEGPRSRLEGFDVGLTQRTLIGTEARLLWQNERLRNPALFRPLDPTVESSASLQVRQPLLRYFWGRPDKARRSLFRSASTAARERLRTKQMEAAAATAEAYLRLLQAQREVAIVEDTVSAAKKLLSVYSDKKRYGLVEDSDLLQARASLEIQETELVLVHSRVTQAQNNLRAVLQRQEAEAQETFVVSEPPPFQFEPSSAEEVVRLAIENRPDFAASKAAVVSAEWSVRIAKLDTLPDLSVEGSYGIGGLDRNYSGAWDDLGSWSHPVKSAGVNLSLPLAFRKERLQRKSSVLQMEEAKRDYELVMQHGLTEVRTAWENWTTSRRRMEAGRRLASLEEKKLRAEQADFSRGRSSTDLVVRFQQDLQRAQRQALQAEIDEYLARIQLARASGTLLTSLGK